MTSVPVFLLRSGMISAYGLGVEACWSGLSSCRTGIRSVDRFDTSAFHSRVAGLVEGLSCDGQESLAFQLLKRLFEGVSVPPDARLLLATTKGEIDLLEHTLKAGHRPSEESLATGLLEKLRAHLGLKDPGAIVSAACASSTAALALAGSMVRRGEAECVLVTACDSVTEFVYSGFSSLMALDPEPARPFDRNRKGLSVGEGAAYALIANPRRAETEGLRPEGEILGWGQSSDANHMTGPSRDGSGQALAIRKALVCAGVAAEDIGSICAHGTGTLYNDSMELKSIRSVFGGRQLPVYSVKGGIGHTMGAAGLMEVLITLKSLGEGRTPPVVNLRDVDDEARGLVLPESRPIPRDLRALSTNSGFGGINAAILLGRPRGEA